MHVAYAVSYIIGLNSKVCETSVARRSANYAGQALHALELRITGRRWGTEEDKETCIKDRPESEVCSRAPWTAVAVQHLEEVAV